MLHLVTQNKFNKKVIAFSEHKEKNTRPKNAIIEPYTIIDDGQLMVCHSSAYVVCLRYLHSSIHSGIIMSVVWELY